MSAPKSTPPNSPMFYYHIAEATYQSDPHKYLDKAFGGRRVQKLEKDGDFGFMDQWKVRFFRDLVSGELIVGFRGTDNGLNWGSDALHCISDSDKLFKTMGKQIDTWRKKAEKHGYGSNISTFVGHSAGGYFVSHVKKDWHVRRITFNGHKCERAGGGGAKLTINLRIGGDIVSKGGGSVKDRYIKVHLPKDPGLKNKILQEVHKLRCFAMAFATDGNSLSGNWFKHPHPVSDYSWYEIAHKYFDAPLLMASSRNEEAIDDEEDSQQSQDCSEDGLREQIPNNDNPVPTVGSSGRELKKIGKRCQEKIVQAAALSALTATKNVCKNFREKSVYEDLHNRDFETALEKLEIEDEVQKSKKVFCETYLSIMSNVLKQGGCVIISGGYVNPLTTRYILEFSISLADPEAHTRRKQLSEAVSNSAMNMIAPVSDSVIGSLASAKGEWWIRAVTNVILDQTPEEAIENLVRKPVERLADKVIGVIPENDFLDRPADRRPNVMWRECNGGYFSYEPGYFTENCENNSLPVVTVKYFAEGLLEATLAVGSMAVHAAALPVHLAGETEMASGFVEGYTSWVQKNLMYTFWPIGNNLRNAYLY